MTTARAVADYMGNDGQEFVGPDGHKLGVVCCGLGVEVERGHGQVIEGRYAPIDPRWTRFIFLDGSAIIDCGVAWDVEGSAPWSWEGGE